jgi:hypothetical protein
VSPIVKNKVENQIDHICISKNWRKSLLDIRNKREADIGSDHHLLMGTIRFFIKRNKKKHTCRRKYHLMKINVPDIQDSLKGKLRAAVFPTESIGEGVEEKWMKIKTVLNGICENTIQYPYKKDKIWISDRTWDIIDKRKQVKIKMSGLYNTRKGKEVEKEYASLDKELKKLIQRDHRRYMDSVGSKAQSGADLGHIKGVVDSIKRLTKVSQVSTVPVKTKAGKYITTCEGQLQRWREFFKEILNSDCSPYEEEDEELTRSVLQLQISVRTPSKREVIYAIKSMKNGEAAGLDNIPAKILTLDFSKASDMLLPLFQEIRQK